MELFLGLCGGIILVMWLFIGLSSWSGHEQRPSENNIVWISEDDNLTCRKNNNYPQLNCQLIKEAIGPKLVDKPASEIVIEGE